MKRVLGQLTLTAPILFVTMLLTAPTALAAPRVPTFSPTDCTATCYSWMGWNGTTYGGSAQIEMTSAGVRLQLPGASLQRWLGLWQDSNGSDSNAAIHAGEEVDQAHSGVCNQANSSRTAYYLVTAWDSGRNITYNHCYDLPGGDANHPSAIDVNPYSSNGGGWLIQIYGWSGFHSTDYIPYANTTVHSWGSMGLQEQINDNVVLHEVWGAYESNWDYVNTSGKYNSQTRNTDFKVTNNPPEMYWVHVPSPSYAGGQAISCDYERDNGPNCKHGG